MLLQAALVTGLPTGLPLEEIAQRANWDWSLPVAGQAGAMPKFSPKPILPHAQLSLEHTIQKQICG